MMFRTTAPEDLQLGFLFICGSISVAVCALPVSVCAQTSLLLLRNAALAEVLRSQISPEMLMQVVEAMKTN